MRSVKPTTLTVVAAQQKKRPRFTAPPTLPPTMARQYREICTELHDGGRFAVNDAMLVEQYLTALHDATRMREIYERDGMVITGDDGKMRPHPLLAAASAARSTSARLAAVLGIGPIYRHKMAVTVESNTTSGGVPSNPWATAAAKKK